jgi:hypothetical protein
MFKDLKSQEYLQKMLFTNKKSITRPKTRTEDDGKDSREHEKQLL